MRFDKIFVFCSSEEELRSRNRKPKLNRAIRKIMDFLDEEKPGWPECTLMPDGDDHWAFFICTHDTTSYLNQDGFEWYGSGWPDRYCFDEEISEFINKELLVTGFPPSRE
uniref:Uncharacterized protein n=1 Tax=Candidatus Kentrum sp. UNK TaxID=2126344 RepID=A0A451ARG8_9GAMM|nr:MAG: hypothetical protein BECKUNK1418G_GA0071005_100559 [Candidatus Kentron sp. UNK]VFK68646.1 MAG: hypothetical protein BECKUNK1418H_GA0071006_100459 [Candidatus Kentron sp. UNK]